MPTDHRAALAAIRTFPQLIAYLRDEMGWPIERIEIDDLTFEYSSAELGIDSRSAAKIEEIKGDPRYSFMFSGVVSILSAAERLFTIGLA